MLEPKLAAALAFTATDLQANRDGRLSDRQQRRLARRVLLLNSVYVATALFFFICALYLEPWATGVRHPLFWVAVFLVLLATGGLHHMLRISEDYSNDVARGHVAAVSGFVRCKFSEWTRGIEGGGEYYIEVLGQRFWVPFVAFEAFQEELKYTVYYLPTVRKVIAAEPSRWG